MRRQDDEFDEEDEAWHNTSYMAAMAGMTHDNLMNNYCNPNSVYIEEDFRLHFRMRRHLFERLLHDVQHINLYFRQKLDKTGCSEEYLREPNQEDLDRFLHKAKDRDFPGMIGSLDFVLGVSPWPTAPPVTNFPRVAVQKDARSDIREIDMKKYHVPGKMILRKFILFIRVSIRISKKRPIFVSFKNTKPPVGALFYEIDEQNKGEDGFRHVTYSGEENVCGSNEEQEHGDKISFENENSQVSPF
ncbi:autophagy-related protein 8B-like [Pyrus ussuriensis x Pyrus communis]|uniref:Autophagy-related protein 8B-like n=1 Tax=Pyrus ussuriensis x Pyrus communis TaxID=2448454 RepID=A0A5N5G3K2_9ROSA|nr:autophagy-related protein 8B-like [Pyrus ussuriensis x Pyrus communis]